MQRFFKWLGKRLFGGARATRRSSVPSETPVVHTVKHAIETNPARKARPQAAATPVADGQLLELETDIGGRIEAVGPGKNVLIRNKYLREDTGTHETLKIVDDSLLDSGETAGFDPYNTGQFDRSETWQARTWK